MKLFALTVGTVSATLGGWLRFKPTSEASSSEQAIGQARGQFVETAADGRTDVFYDVSSACTDLFMEAWQRVEDSARPVAKIVAEPAALFLTRLAERAGATLQAQIPDERMAQFREAAGGAQQNGEAVFRNVEAMARAAAQALHARLSGPASSAIQAFVERHPEHQGILADRDPIAVAGLLTVIILVVLWELYCFWCIVWFLARRVLAAACCLLCCGRRRVSAAATPNQEELLRAQLEQSSARVAELEGLMAAKAPPPESAMQHLKAMGGGA